MAEIKFGTSGWRAVIAADFTFENVRLATAGIVELIKKSGPQSRLMVGYDTRFQADKFAWECAEFLSSRGIRVCYCPNPVPTPTVAFEIIRRQLNGGINFTASHNPGEYCGLKFSSADGAPALPEITRQIEQNIRDLQAGPRVWNEWAPRPELIETVDPATDYLKALSTKIDLPLIRKSGPRISYDPLYGTARGYLDKLLAEADIAVSTIHNFRDVMFGGHPPEP